MQQQTPADPTRQSPRHWLDCQAPSLNRGPRRNESSFGPRSRGSGHARPRTVHVSGHRLFRADSCEAWKEWSQTLWMHFHLPCRSSSPHRDRTRPVDWLLHSSLHKIRKWTRPTLRRLQWQRNQLQGRRDRQKASTERLEPRQDKTSSPESRCGVEVQPPWSESCRRCLGKNDPLHAQDFT